VLVLQQQICDGRQVMQRFDHLHPSNQPFGTGVLVWEQNLMDFQNRKKKKIILLNANTVTHVTKNKTNTLQ